MDSDRARRSLLALLPAVADAIRREADRISRANFCDCNASDIHMLATIHFRHDGSARPSDLTGSIHTTSAGVTGSLRRLESAGYVQRHKTPDDRRVYLAVVTESGRATAEAAVPAFNELALAVTEGLEDSEVEHLAAVVQRYLKSTVEDRPVTNGS